MRILQLIVSGTLANAGRLKRVKNKTKQKVKKKQKKKSSTKDRTPDLPICSRTLYRLSYKKLKFLRAPITTRMAMLYQEVHAGKKTRKYSMAG
jgi:hypothetical protein